MKDNKKLKIVIFILGLWGFFMAVMLISNIVSTRKSLDKIIYNAKVEAEKSLISSGLAVYTKDIENEDVGESSSSAKNLPENTTSTPQQAGTIVQPKGNCNIETVTAISVGNGDTVPVPIGFYYVGGNLSSGVVISDNIADQNKYAGQSNVPSGIKVNADGTLGNELVGNQFVWIPCEYSEYAKTNWGQGNVTNRSNACWDTTVDEAGIIQTKKHGGFYVGRYEAGLASNIEEYTGEQTWSSAVYNVDGIPQSKAGLKPWNFVNWEQSRKNARNMYNTATVNSGLITGTQWDVMINKIANSDNAKSITDSENWGNHYNTTLTYTGRSVKTVNDELSTFGGEETNATKNGNTYVLITTGGAEMSKGYNIYDVAGNLWEWTEETSYYGANTTNEYREIRGSGFNSASAVYPVCYRSGASTASSTSASIGFRVVLYMK